MNIFYSLLIWLLLSKCIPDTLIYSNFFGNTSMASVDWKYYSTPTFHSCSTAYPIVFSSFITKAFKLDPHYQLRLKFTFWTIDLWYSNRFLVYVESNIKIDQQYYSGNSSAGNLCGNASYSDSSYNFDITVDHSSPTALIYINSERFTGISDFYLYINKCPDGCDSCDQTLCYNQILFREYFTDINFSVINFSEGWLSATNLWTKNYSENYLINCRDYSIHTTSFQVFTKTIQLDAHDAVSFSLKIITINLYHQIEILIDNVLIIYSDHSNCIDFRTPQCEICTIVNHINIREHFHKKNKITIAIRLRVMQNYVFSSGYYLGIRDFQIFIRPFLNDDFCSDENIYPFDGCFAQIYDCVEGCSNCVKGVCIECYEGWEYQEQTKECIPICGDSIITHLEECDDGNTNPYDGCYQCKFSCPQDCLLFSFGQCSIWSTSYIQLDNFSYSINLNLKLPIQNNNSNSIQCQYLYDSLECYNVMNKQTSLFFTCDSNNYLTDKRLKLYNRQICDDGNQVEFDGCHQCKYSCPLNCKECQFGKCKLCLSNYVAFQGKCLYICDGSGSQIEQENNSCYNRIKNMIENGHYQHNLFHSETSKYIQVSSLNCSSLDFGIFGYFYNQCEIPKIRNCKESLFNKCIECDQNYELNKNQSICVEICNDGIAIGSEVCDDLNNVQFDGCYKCQQSCLLECLNCVENKCYQCLEGWQLIDYSCYQYCGDGQLAQSSMEQCDDGNFSNQDGCFECKFECVPYCSSCADRQICFLCESNFELNNGICIPICGDNVIVPGLEECEDGNQAPYDGCYNCMFQCEQECQTCGSSGYCEVCFERYEINNKVCQVKKESEDYESSDDKIVKCGDTFLQKNEECDDGNEFDGDGCSKNCTIETNYGCNLLYNPNICFLLPIIQLTFLNITQSIQYIQLSFSDQVKLKEKNINFSEKIISSFIPSLSSEIYRITNIPAQLNSFFFIIVDIQENELQNVNYTIKIEIFEPIQTQIELDVQIKAELVDINDLEFNPTRKSIKLQTPKFMSNSQLQAANNFQVLGFGMMIGLAISSFALLLFGDPSQCMEILDTLQFQSYLKYINVDYPQNIQIYFESSEFVSVSPVLVQIKIIDFLEYFIGYQYLESTGKFLSFQINADLLVNIYGQITQIGFLVGIFLILKFYKQMIFTKCFGSKFFYYVRSVNNKGLEYMAIKIYYINKKILEFQNSFTIDGIIQLFHANSWDLIFKVLIYLNSNYKNGHREFISNIISICYLTSIVVILSQNLRGKRSKIKQHDDISLIKKLLFLIFLVQIQGEPLFQCLLLSCVLIWYIGSISAYQFTQQHLDLLIIIWMEAPVTIFTLSKVFFK